MKVTIERTRILLIGIGAFTTLAAALLAASGSWQGQTPKREADLVPPSNVADRAKVLEAESRQKTDQLGTASRPVDALPAKFSWRTPGSSIVTPSRDQGSSNACWAFATIAAFESAYAKANGLEMPGMPRFSEQAVIDCSGAGTARGGGWWAFAYLRDFGATPYDDVPFTGRDPEQRPEYCGRVTPFRATNIGYVDPSDPMFPSRDLLKRAIFEHGPVAVGMIATDDFFSHHDGSVFKGNFGPDGGYDRSAGANTAVLIVGWDDEKGAWIVKAFFGPDNWGVAGFGYVAYETNNVGYGAAWVDAAVQTDGLSTPPVPGKRQPATLGLGLDEGD